MGSVGTPPVDPVELASVVEVGVEVVDVSPVAVELVDGELVGLVVVAGAGAGVVAEPAASARSIDWNPTPERSASCCSWTRRLAWSPSCGHRLAQHDQLPVVGRERLLLLRSRGGRLLGLLELRLKLVDVLLEARRLVSLRRQDDQPDRHDQPDDGQREQDGVLLPPHGAAPVPGMNVSTALRPFSVFCAAESFCC